MKKLLAILLLVVSPVSYGATSGSTHFASGFVQSTRLATSLTQESTGYNYSCGPTAFLYVLNYHFYRKYGEAVWYTESTAGARYAIEAAYDGIPGRGLNATTSTDQLKALGKKWSFSESVKANGDREYSGEDVWERNKTNMINRLKNNQPVIVSLNAEYSPVGQDHIVVIFGYDTSRQLFIYFDPYFGKFYGKYDDSMRKAVQGQLPYLVLVPWA